MKQQTENRAVAQQVNEIRNENMDIVYISIYVKCTEDVLYIKTIYTYICMFETCKETHTLSLVTLHL